MIGSILGRGASFVGKQLVKKFSKEGVKKEATKQTAVGATGLGVTSASPAHAPTRDGATISPEAKAPAAAPQSLPDLSHFGPGGLSN